MRKAYLRDKVKRKLSINNEIKNVILHSIVKNNSISMDFKQYFFNTFNKSGAKSTLVRCHNFCHITFRSRSVYRFFGLERFSLKQKVMYGLLPAIKYRVKW